MKNQKVILTKKQFFKSEKIEVYPQLTDEFGSNFNLAADQITKDGNADFQVDRLFSVIHEN